MSSSGWLSSDHDFEPRSWCFKALTPIWTGGAERTEKRLIPTGLLGSIRWWFEVLVRGLGGSACDPTFDANRCPAADLKQAGHTGYHCVVCELFGCTGWARKFRFQVLDKQDNTMSSAIAKGTEFQLRFVPLRGIGEEEWALLRLTFFLIADYGAIGGRTVFKPSDENSRANAEHHQDYGLVSIVRVPKAGEHIDPETLRKYVTSERWRKVNDDDFAWASLKNFWCVKGKYLARLDKDKSTFNKIVGRDERKTCRDCGGVHNPPQHCPKTSRAPRRDSEQVAENSACAPWLAGKQRESKKVFSFKEPADARRTFGFVKSKKSKTVGFDKMKEKLKQAWPDLEDTDFQTGEAILEALFKSGREHEQ